MERVEGETPEPRELYHEKGKFKNSHRTCPT